MRRGATPRRDRPDLLTRPPARSDGGAGAWAAAMILDPVAPLVELAELRRRGLISPHEYELQKAKVIHPEPPADQPEAGPPSCAAPHPRPRHAIPPPACGRSSSGGI